MLNDDEQRIRDVVRFDASLDRCTVVVELIHLVEKYASEVVVEPRLSLDDFLKHPVGSGTNPKPSAKRSARSGSASFSNHLAELHLRINGSRSSLREGSQSARSAVFCEFFAADLVKAVAPPLSLLFATHRDTYESASESTEMLADVIGRAIDRVVPITLRFAEEATSIERMWRERLAPKPGTVLDVLIGRLLSYPVITSERLIGVTGANKSNVYRAFDSLESIGALEETTGRKKDRVWVAREVTNTMLTALRRAARTKISAD